MIEIRRKTNRRSRDQEPKNPDLLTSCSILLISIPRPPDLDDQK
jgi:hypothetical protein